MNAIAANRRFAQPAPGAQLARRRERIPLGVCVAGGLVGSYFARASLAAHMGTPWTMQLVSQLPVAALVAGGLYVAAGGVLQLRASGVAMIAAAGLSLWSCETRDFAAARWIGWSLMLAAIGPVSTSPLARNLRAQSSKLLLATLVATTLTSAGWRLAGMPHLGVGDFSGVMWHSMTLGPLAALCGVHALARALSRPAGVWYGVYGLSAIVALWASSRAALAALALGSAAMLALRVRRHPLVSLTVVAVALVAVAIPEAAVELGSRALPESLTAGLLRKSWDHSREAHWEARWEEFCYVPITGIGFACGWENSAGYDEESGAIETGSSYFSLLSMTGLLGASAFALLAVRAAAGTLRYWRFLTDLQRLEIVGIAAFWFVDLGAEGYVYGVGSVLSLAFWLWLGQVMDQLDAAANVRAAARVHGSKGAP